MYPFSIPTDEHVALQLFNRLSMYTFKISTDEHVPLKSRMTNYLIMIIHIYI